ncbi:MAG: methyl-accepting chemotaxis protein, partial [Psychrosphaera sp.]|nr:methyl-accepting chemotaxis protein [Psychrosphaera sp.]
MIIMMFVSLCLFSIFQVNLIAKELDSIVTKDIPLSQIFTRIAEHQLEQEITYMENFIHHLQALDEHGNTGVSSGAGQSHEKFDRLDEKVNDEFKQAQRLLQTSLATSTEHEKVEFESLKRQFEKIEQLRFTWQKSTANGFNLLAEQKTSQAFALEIQIEAQAQELSHAIEGIQEDIASFTAKATQNAIEHENQLIYIFVISLPIIFLAAFLLTHDMTKTIQKAFAIIHAGLGSMSARDFSTKINNRGAGGDIGELLDDIEQMRIGIHSVLNQVYQASAHMLESAQNMAKSAQQSLLATTAQTTEIGNATTAITELTASAHEVSTNAENTKKSAQYADSTSRENSALMEQTNQVILSLGGSVSDATSKINQLSKDSEQIATVMDVIKGIASQTNLLALNAAIDAARAGEVGRGFAVVADEVRSLAQRTQESAAEIESMILSLKQGTESAVSSMTQCSELGGTSVELTEKVNQGMAEVVDTMLQLNEMNSQIALASSEQTTVISHINESIVSVNSSAIM